MTVAVSGTEIGQSTGHVYSDPDPRYKWYEFDYKPGFGFGYIRSDLCTLVDISGTITASMLPQNNDTEAQQTMNEITTLDTETINELNTCAALIDSLKSRNINTAAANNEVVRLYNSVKKRQDEIEKSATQTKWGKITGTVSTAASNAWGSLRKFLGFSGVGSLTATLIIVGVSIVVGSGATALVVLKPHKNSANIDKKAAEKIRKELEAAGLDPATVDKVVSIARKEVVNAYNVGNRQGSFGSFSSLIKYAAIAGVALLVMPKLLEMITKNKAAYKNLKK